MHGVHSLTYRENSGLNENERARKSERWSYDGYQGVNCEDGDESDEKRTWGLALANRSMHASIHLLGSEALARAKADGIDVSRRRYGK